jgi:hypothetical protein
LIGDPFGRKQRLATSRAAKSLHFVQLRGSADVADPNMDDDESHFRIASSAAFVKNPLRV